MVKIESANGLWMAVSLVDTLPVVTHPVTQSVHEKCRQEIFSSSELYIKPADVMIWIYFKLLVGGKAVLPYQNSCDIIVFQPPPHISIELANMRAHTYTHTDTKQSKSYGSQLLQYSEPVMACLWTTQSLEPCVGKSSWGSASNPQEHCQGLMDRG